MSGADAVLDTFPVGGGITSLEAIAHCAPVVTFSRGVLSPRFTRGFLVQGLGPATAEQLLLANTKSEFIERALKLARDKGGELKQRVREAWLGGGLKRVFGWEAGTEAAKEWSDLLLRTIDAS